MTEKTDYPVLNTLWQFNFFGGLTSAIILTLFNLNST